MMQPFILMEQYRSSLTPRTQRRSQNICSDTAKIRIFSDTTQLFLMFFHKLRVFDPFVAYKRGESSLFLTPKHATLTSSKSLTLDGLQVNLVCAHLIAIFISKVICFYAVSVHFCTQKHR